MQTIKSIALLIIANTFAIISFGQTTTKTATSTVAKVASTPAKTVSSTTKAPSTINSKTASKKTTTTKTLQKGGSTKTTTSVKTQTTPSTKQIGEPVQTKTFVPVIQKTEPTIVIPKPQVNNQTEPTKAEPNTNNQTGRKTTTETNTETPNNAPQTGGGRKGTDTNNNTTPGGNSIINTITEGDASSAIKEALMKGIQVGVDKVSVTDGYLGNSMIKIPFPSQVSQVESALRNFGMGSLVDNAVTSMNRAAENAASQAVPIFINSIKQMTVTDAVNIVSNKQPDAATQFLQRTTTESLVSSFKPSIKTALDKTLATKYWSDITSYYNKIPFVSPINTDLPDYVTRKAIDGLFIMVAQEEAKIRKDPAGQANEIIKTVFGKVKF